MELSFWDGEEEIGERGREGEGFGEDLRGVEDADELGEDLRGVEGVEEDRR